MFTTVYPKKISSGSLRSRFPGPRGQCHSSDQIRCGFPEDLCRVEIDKKHSQTIQLSGNQFQILVTEPTQLTKIFLDGKTKADTIGGVYILTFSDNCPKAITPDHIFIRNPHVVSSQQLIALPLTHLTPAFAIRQPQSVFFKIAIKPKSRIIYTQTFFEYVPHILK